MTTHPVANRPLRDYPNACRVDSSASASTTWGTLPYPRFPPMSNAILNRAYQSTVKSPTDMAVLASLADQANDDGICWPSVGTISRRTRLVERTVQKALRRLTKEHHISVTGSIDGGLRRQTPRYVVHPVKAAVTGAADSPVQEMHPSTGAGNSPVQEMHPTGELSSPHGRTTFTPRVNHVHPNHHRTVKEPSVNRHARARVDARARTHAREDTSVLLDVDPSSKKSKGGAAALSVEWDGVAFQVPPALLEQWRASFPALDVNLCILEAAAWVIDHPSRSLKKPGARFLEGWLKRTRPSDSPPADDDADPQPPPEPPPAPEGWERAWEDLYGFPPDRAWETYCDDFQFECRQWLSKHQRDQ